MNTPHVDEAARARAALAVIPADDYGTWVDMAFALKQGFGDEGFEIWYEWSRTAGNYSERAARTTWRSADASGGKTLASLFWLARQHGFDLKRSQYPDRMATAPVPSSEVLERRTREEERKQARHAAVAREADALWQWSRPVGPQHPYLTRKRLDPVETLRELDAQELRSLLGYAPMSEEEPLVGRVLIVPVWIDAISTLELIDELGRKSSLAGGVKKGGYWMAESAPTPEEASGPILIGEGMATALSTYRATGWFAAAALSSGNLGQVAAALRERYRDNDLIVLAELGQGEAEARRAAQGAMAHLALPVFAKDARVDGKVPNDFCDMAVLSGFDVVGDYLREVAFRSLGRANRLRDMDVMSHVQVREMDERNEEGEMSRSRQNSVDDTEGNQRHQSSERSVPKHAVPESDAAAASDGSTAPVVPAATLPRFAPTRAPVGEPLFGLGDVPEETKALAGQRFGIPLRMATPRENGGPYRGEVFNTEHYLIQEVATRSVVFHRKDQMEFISERLKWMDGNARLNGSEVQVGYDGDRSKVYPWDRARDLLERTVGSLKKSAHELNFSPNLETMLDQLQARSWARIREARAAALEKSKQHTSSPEPAANPDR
ncbi:PriCT-2 domain-containing protein [Burkholderia sp. 9120]|uniref:PriCT-2 domain-containing protein n=1 Tax=Burkholderia sp. 9120 TaxID=1500897 RepID=UPI000553203A|nr:PriCT-2 domain-containing protein [Burkholderia sp. 9120]